MWRNGPVRLDRSSTRKHGALEEPFGQMLQAELRDTGSAAANIWTYMSDTFEPGEVVMDLQ